jgi:hypothetical protein
MLVGAEEMRESGNTDTELYSSSVLSEFDCRYPSHSKATDW